MSLEALRARWEHALAHRGCCERCDGVRIWHCGTRTRKATILLEDEPVFVPDIPERRLKCRDCGLSWTFAPEGISSRAHYQPCVVAAALARTARARARRRVGLEHARECSGPEISRRSTLARVTEKGGARDDDKARTEALFRYRVIATLLDDRDAAPLRARIAELASQLHPHPHR